MQIHHFTKRIEANPQWELVEIYQDEGISATTVEKRLGFQKMIADAVGGKIDLILTKASAVLVEISWIFWTICERFLR